MTTSRVNSTGNLFGTANLLPWSRAPRMGSKVPRARTIGRRRAGHPRRPDLVLRQPRVSERNEPNGPLDGDDFLLPAGAAHGPQR